MSLILSSLLLTTLLGQLGGQTTTVYELRAPSVGGDFGRSLAAFSDYDGDGIDDFLVGAPLGHSGGLGAVGKVYLYSSATGNQLLELQGEQAGSSFGAALCGVGDIDGDGVEDILVGAPTASPSGMTEAGSTYLYSGSSGALLQQWNGTQSYDNLGQALCGMGDLNGDGTPDYVIGVPNEDSPRDSGAAYMISGASGTLLRQHHGVEKYDLFGTALANAGDINGDGIHDLLVGAPNADSLGVGSSGVSYVYSGSNGVLLHQLDGPPASRFGASVTGMADTDGDGVNDLLIGARLYGGGGWIQRGSAWLYSGATGLLLQQWTGNTDFQGLGSMVASAGDVNGDGFDDALFASQSSSSVEVYSGATGALLQAFSFAPGIGNPESHSSTDDVDGDGTPDVLVSVPGFNLVGIFSGATGLLITQLAQSASHDFSASVASAGDVNGGGFPDIVIGDSSASAQNRVKSGAVTVYSGDTGDLLYLFAGANPDDEIGTAVASAGDVNGDGFDDILVGASRISSGGALRAGAAYVYSGADGSILHTFLGVTNDWLGHAVGPAGDINHDGFDDFLIGAPQASPGGRQHAGSVYLYSGVNGSLLRQFDGNTAGDQLGASLASMRDINADGTRDIILGAAFASPGGRHWAGAVLVYSGADGSILHQYAGVAESRLGTDVHAAGDVDGDGIDDFMAGAPDESPGGWREDGAVYIWSGATGLELHRILGESLLLYFGNAVSPAGDVDADGFDDILIGAERGTGGFGAALVYSGATGALLSRTETEVLEEAYGESIANLGDINGDGKLEFVVGSIFHNGLGETGFATVLQFQPFLHTDTYFISATTGAQVQLELRFPDAAGFEDYKVLMSTTGVGPSVYGVAIPLSDDAMVRQTFGGNYPFAVHANLQGSLDLSGAASASVDFPAGLPFSLVGRTLWVAAIVNPAGARPNYSSVAIPITITP